MKIFTQLTELQKAKGDGKKVVLYQTIGELIEGGDTESLLVLLQTLDYLFDKRVTSGINKKSLDKVQTESVTEIFDGLPSFLEYVTQNNTGKNSVIVNCKEYISHFPKAEGKILEQILCKNFKMGMTAKTINKVYDDFNRANNTSIPLIFNWEVQGGMPYEKLKLADGEVFALQEKLNGVRATYFKGSLKARSGLNHVGFMSIIKEIEQVFGTDYVLDGELILPNSVGHDDNQNFRETLSIVGSDTYSPDKERVVMKIYDIVPLAEFETGKFKKKYIDERMDFIQSFKNKCVGSHVVIEPILYVGSDQSKIEELLDKMDAEGKEGMMLYKNAKYKKAKHNGLIKVKTFKFSDLEIVDWFMGKETGKLKGKFGGFIVNYKGNRVSLGGKYSDELREELLETADSYIGRIAEVKYKDESRNAKTGEYSLQFPQYIRCRFDKDEVSYE